MTSLIGVSTGRASAGAGRSPARAKTRPTRAQVLVLSSVLRTRRLFNMTSPSPFVKFPEDSPAATAPPRSFRFGVQDGPGDRSKASEKGQRSVKPERVGFSGFVLD